MGGDIYTLLFTWDAISSVMASHGEAPDFGDPSVLAHVIACGLAKHHPEVTADDVREMSPPLVATIDRVQLAYRMAWIGPDEVKREDASTAKAEKKSHGKSGWWMRFVWPWKRASAQGSSGA